MSKNPVLSLAALLLLPLVAVTSTSRTAESREVHYDSFLPPNNLKHKIGALDAGGISQDQFNAVMDQMQALYGPIVAAKGGVLVINRLWTDDTVNASAERQGNNYVLNMYGGLARDKAITQDGMSLVVCHEMGHHLGGAPKFGGADWASNEGEADYFAVTKCLHRMFGAASAQSFTRPVKAAGDDGQIARAACAQSYADAKSQAVCLRSAMAGQSVTALFTELSGDAPSHFDTPDASVVTTMFDDHPASQCRLDTYFQGTLCPKAYTIDMDDADPGVGACVASQGFKVGLRPRCWYLPPSTEPSLTDVPAASAAAKAPASASFAALKSADPFKGL
jgi:hypothetical protein